MTTKELLRELVEEIPDELADDALNALRVVYPARARKRAGFIGMVSIKQKRDLGSRAKAIVRDGMGDA